LFGADGDDGVARRAAELRSIERALSLARELGYAIGWTVHEPARFAPGLDSLHRRVGVMLASASDVVFVHDAAAADAVTRWLDPSGEIVVAPLAHYGNAHRGGRSAAEVGAELGLEPSARVVLAFGELRPDKDLPLLLRGFRRVEDPNAVLVVAGDADPEAVRLMGDGATRDSRVRPLVGQVADEDVRAIFGLAHVHVLARSSLWTPSSLILAASLEVPVVAADLECHRLAIGSGAFWFAPHDEVSLAHAISTALTEPELARSHASAAGSFVRIRDWPDMARIVARGLRRAVRSTDGRVEAGPAELVG
jgi:glycosyltransferase involved in cell wall biosynthesis